MRKGIEILLKSKSSYRIAKDLNINARTVNRYQNGTSEIDKMEFGTAEKLYNYYLEEMANVEKTMWEFEGYTVYLETDVLRFEDNEGDVLGYVMNEGNELVEELNNGVDPIAEGWEDGVGNTINIDGWGGEE